MAHCRAVQHSTLHLARLERTSLSLSSASIWKPAAVPFWFPAFRKLPAQGKQQIRPASLKFNNYIISPPAAAAGSNNPTAMLTCGQRHLQQHAQQVALSHFDTGAAQHCCHCCCCLGAAGSLASKATCLHPLSSCWHLHDLHTIGGQAVRQSLSKPVRQAGRQAE